MRDLEVVEKKKSHKTRGKEIGISKNFRNVLF
jgi:hypothetical protein